MSTASPQSQIENTASLPHLSRGTLRIYLGAAPGVGKTYAMLDEGRRRMARGTDVVIGFVETHDRPKTAAEIGDLPLDPAASAYRYRGQRLEEMDVDAILARRPALALVDELAHTNVAGSRNEKRWQDVEELLEAGIDVISTLNIQHLGSLERRRGANHRYGGARDDPRRCRAQGRPDRARRHDARRRCGGAWLTATSTRPTGSTSPWATSSASGNLAALRELALLWVADRVDDDLNAYRERHGIEEPWETKERIVVALSGAPGERASDPPRLPHGRTRAWRAHRGARTDHRARRPGPAGVRGPRPAAQAAPGAQRPVPRK